MDRYPEWSDLSWRGRLLATLVAIAIALVGSLDKVG